MRRAAALAAALLLAMTTAAQTSQDFAAKFMEQCEEDTALQCVTISPKMMEELAKQPDTDGEEHIAQALQKIKSARIITASTRGEEYYEMAEELLRDNPQRFAHAQDFQTESAHGTFYTRRSTSGDIVELIMLHTDTIKGNLIIVNLTGDIDAEFVESLTRHMGGPTAMASANHATRPRCLAANDRRDNSHAATRRYFLCFLYNNHV